MIIAYMIAALKSVVSIVVIVPKVMMRTAQAVKIACTMIIQIVTTV